MVEIELVARRADAVGEALGVHELLVLVGAEGGEGWRWGEEDREATAGNLGNRRDDDAADGDEVEPLAWETVLP